MLPKAVQKPRGHYEKIYSDSGGSGGAGDGHFVSQGPHHIFGVERGPILKYLRMSRASNFYPRPLPRTGR